MQVSPGRYRAVVAVALVALGVIVVTGAAVRLTESGLGCTDWPTCEQGRLAPEWGFHGWIEFGNRLFTGVVSASVAAAVLAARWRVPRRRDLELLAWGLVAGVAAQVVLGGVTVLVGLHPVAVIGHFLLSMVLVANAVVLLDRAGSDRPTTGGRALGPHSWVVLALAALVLVAGTVVTGTGPHGGDRQAERLALDLSWVARIHASLVWVFVATLAVLAVRVARTGDGVVLARARTVLVVAVLQGALGYLQYALHVPAGLVVLHVLGSVLVWSAALWLHLGVLRSPLRADWSHGRRLPEPTSFGGGAIGGAAPGGRDGRHQPVTG
jgi:heme a synthase